jgi:hypothetical protein
MLQLRWQWYILTLVCWIFTSCASPQESDIAEPADSTVGQVALALEDSVPCADGDHGACSDDNVCTVDMCLDGICRHGPVDDPNCCNSDEECDDGNPCTDDWCPPDNQCSYQDNDLANCCSNHADCGPGGPWDDQDPSTIDYCMSHQCVHTKDASCKCGDLYPCQADADPCTADVCVDGMCKYLQIPGCCQADSDCEDYHWYTFDHCLDGWCVFEALDVCWQDSQCDDGNPCNIDSCVNGYCRYTPNPALPDCCTGDQDCDDGSSCTTESCHTDAKMCIRELVVPHEPKCCWTAEDCDDDDPLTLDKCVDNQCTSAAPPCLCDESSPLGTCGDGNPCTDDTCSDCVCHHEQIMGCCLKDADCSSAALTDGNPCTQDICDLATNTCLYVPLAVCPCMSDVDCHTSNNCTQDFCIAGTCKHPLAPGCCTASSECDDNNWCTIDSCDTQGNTCNHAVNLNDPLCCATPADCNDGDPSTIDVCVNNFCGNQMTPNCCWEPGCNVGCDDGNPCTCDFCGGGWCRNAPPGFGPDCCGIPLNCCNSDKDCVHPPSPLMTGTCTDNLCSYAMPASGLKPPLLESFSGCKATEGADWIITDVGDDVQVSSQCTAAGPLGPDNHYLIEAQPAQAALFEVYFSTPPLVVGPGKPLTVQFDFDISPAQGQAGLFAHLKEDLPCATPGQSFVPLWQSSQEEPTGTTSVEVPPEHICNGLRIAFGMTGKNASDGCSLSIDSVRICHGLSPEWTAVPDDMTIQAGDKLEWKVSALDPDSDSPTIWVKTAPDFVQHSSTQFSESAQTWNMILGIDPKPTEKPGDYPVELLVSDGCLKQAHTFVVTVLPDD